MKIDLKRKELVCTIMLLLIVVAIAPDINALIITKKRLITSWEVYIDEFMCTVFLHL